MNVRRRGAIDAALEAMAAGDNREATAILESVQEDSSANRSYRCPRCRGAYRRPRELDHHVRFADAAEEDAA